MKGTPEGLPCCPNCSCLSQVCPSHSKVLGGQGETPGGESWALQHNKMESGLTP